MFGIGGGEFFVIILVVLMLFGSDKIPEIARGLGKGMQQLKNATNDIKSEIHKSADVDGIKKSFNDIGNSSQVQDIKNTLNGVDTSANSLTENITGEITKAKEDIEDMTGPIKRIR
ncbi:twin-arginine translocase TatA/TatE family subunit [Flavobacterium sp. DG1-102-2]|uniref:Sec-independent protein translocase subunit TatA/TatB n=1 Tax=Flavobacterium sp. DG1-102-2 TaxID=3081663 RepID=UPI00294A05CB|nr:twin-arginine translocase TatA/TatE family subunit [Flavobacterium sp. DG1-102-2]MDV6169108.1 twin-arginine translocase TatA/TatE family subunit [Flavobacterium sp. DG1-102-2]